MIACLAELNTFADVDHLVKAIDETAEASGLFVIGDALALTLYELFPMVEILSVEVSEMQQQA